MLTKLAWGAEFLVLDDVISSFDTTHRHKFANLIIEKFADWQINPGTDKV